MAAAKSSAQSAGGKAYQYVIGWLAWRNEMKMFSNAKAALKRVTRHKRQA
jgi:hypothetical protein